MTIVSHLEWRCTSLQAATAFLETVFGWRFRRHGQHYAEHAPPSGPRVGLHQVAAVPPAGACQGYLRVADLDACLQRAGAAGAELECPPTGIPRYGRYARIRIPGQAVIGLFQWDDSR